MSPSGVERDLELTTRFTKGLDVKALQEGLNAISRRRAVHGQARVS
jgi:hypothetical protein